MAWRWRRGLLGAVLAMLGAGAPGLALADDLDFLREDKRVFSIQPRPYRLGHEFHLGVGVLPLDAYYVGILVAAGYTYHFSDFWAWEIAGAGYSINIDTELEGQLRDDYGVAPTQEAGRRIRVVAATNAVIKPLFGKLAFFNEDIVHAETFFTLGVGPTLYGDAWIPTVNAGLGLRFWWTEALAVRFDIRDYLLFRGAVPDNALLFQLSAAFNVYDGEIGGAQP